MFAPIRALLSPRRGADPALLAAASGVSLLFAATPFLIPDVSDRFGVSLGTAGLISAVQVLGFAVTTFVAGRRLRPRRGHLVGAGLVAVACNALSAAVGVFPLLLALRAVAGAAAGLFTWIAWSDAMVSAASMRDIAAIGPLTVLVGAPLLGWVSAAGGDRALYLALSATPLPAVLLPLYGVSGATPPGRRRMSPSRSNIVLLAALGMLTMAGSAFFVFVGAFGRHEVGIGAVAVALGFSLNAGAGLVAARWRRRPAFAWPWMALIAVSATGMIYMANVVVFYAAMFLWGFAFWMAVPTILAAIASWSLTPDERVGDAQSIMALGRAIGPAVGGALVGGGRFAVLGVFTGLGLAVGAGMIGTVERYRRASPGARPAGSVGAD